MNAVSLSLLVTSHDCGDIIEIGVTLINNRR